MAEQEPGRESRCDTSSSSRLLIAVLTPLIYFGLDASHVMPIEASAQAVPVDWMWNMDMGAISFLFALVMVPLIYALIVFRRRKGEVGRRGAGYGQQDARGYLDGDPTRAGHRLCVPGSLLAWGNPRGGAQMPWKSA